MNLSTLNNFLRELRQSISGEVRADELSRTLYSSDASIYQVKPYGVLIPRSVADIQAAIKLAAKYHIPILPRGGGTSMAGQTVNEALVIDTTPYLNRILEVNTDEKWARAEPGAYLSSLNTHLKPYGLKYGPDPAPVYLCAGALHHQSRPPGLANFRVCLGEGHLQPADTGSPAGRIPALHCVRVVDCLHPADGNEE